MHQSATGGPKAFQITDCRNDHRRTTSAPPFDPSLAESGGGILRKWVAPFAVAIALLSAFLTFMVLSGLTPIEPTRAGRLFVPADQCGDHPAAGRHHRPRSLAGDSGAAAWPGRSEAARPDRQPVLDHRRAAGGAGRDRRQRDHRPRPRPAVLRPDARGDPELAERCPRLHATSTRSYPWRHPGHGQRYCPVRGRCTIRIASRFGNC